MVLGNYSMMNMNLGGYNPFLSGMGIMGGFGGGCYGNIWSMSGLLGGCNNMDYGAMAGYGVANALLNVGLMAAGSAYQHKQAEKAANSKEALQTKLNDYNNKINKQLAILGASSEADGLNAKVEASYKDAVTDTEKELNDAVSKVSTELPRVESQITTVETAISNLQAQIDAADEDTDTSALTEALSNKRAELKELEAEQKELKELDKKTKAPNGELYKAHEKAKADLNARGKAIDAAKETLKTLIEERDAVQKTLNDITVKEQAKAEKKALNKADGNIFNRKGGENKAYKIEEQGILTEEGGLEKGDWRALIHDYSKASVADQKKIEQFVKTNWSKIEETFSDKDTIYKGLELIKNKA